MPQQIYGSNQNSNPLVDALLQALSKPQSLPAQMPPQTPAGDIRPIVATGYNPRTDSVGGQQMNDNTPVALPAQRPAPVLDDNGQTFVGRLLSRLAVPLATAGVGMAVPAALPGAAGFQTGYTGEIAKIDENIRKQKLLGGMVPTYTVDAEGNPIITGSVPKNAKKVGSQKSPDELRIRAQATRELSAMLGQNPTLLLGSDNPSEAFNQLLEQRVDELKSIGSGVKQAQDTIKQVQSSTQVPDGVPPDIWNKATPEQKQEFLRKKYGG